jgi:hypothetical protein
VLSTPASPGSLRWVAIGLAVLLVALLIVFPCPPWSLKAVIAQRAQCVANLKQIAQDLRDRGIPLDERHSAQVHTVLDGWNVECPEGTEIRGRPAHYILLLKEGSCFITEDRGNHPARMRIMAGSVDEKYFGIDAGGKIFHYR